jgi:hypothetical protein
VVTDFVLADVSPFIVPDLSTGETQKATTWMPSVNAFLASRYGDVITDASKPLYAPYVAEAIAAKLRPTPRGIARQSVPSGSVEYVLSPLGGGWFSSGDLSAMDSLAGIGGVRTVRMPAPDAVRYGNLVEPVRFIDDVVAGS